MTVAIFLSAGVNHAIKSEGSISFLDSSNYLDVGRVFFGYFGGFFSRFGGTFSGVCHDDVPPVKLFVNSSALEKSETPIICGRYQPDNVPKIKACPHP